MKIAVVYTGTTPELLQTVETLFTKHMDGIPFELMSYKNPEILQEARDHGKVTAHCAKELVKLFFAAMNDGANIIVNACSSVGDVAKIAAPLFEMMGIALIRIDEDMAMDAVKNAKRIGVVATLPTTLEPTKRLLLDCAKKQNKAIELVDALAEGAFGLDSSQFMQMLIETGGKIKGEVDALLFAQGSMAYAEEAVSKALNMPVYSSVRYGAAALRSAVDALTTR